MPGIWAQVIREREQEHDDHGIHAAGDAPGMPHVPFFKHDDPLPGTHLFGPYSHHHAGTPSADDQHICTQGHVWAAYIVSFFCHNCRSSICYIAVEKTKKGALSFFSRRW